MKEPCIYLYFVLVDKTEKRTSTLEVFKFEGRLKRG